MKRALLGADLHETTIHLRLAKLYNDLEDYREAAVYHQRVIDTLVADGVCRILPLTVILILLMLRHSRTTL